MHEKIDARKVRLGPSDLEPVLEGAKTLLVSNGRSVTSYDLTKRVPDRADMLARMIGPTGNLRAPTIRRNGLVVVGYHADSMGELTA